MEENISREEKKESEIIGSSLIDFLYVIAKARYFLILFIGLFVGGAITLALLTPNTYKATASVLPAGESEFIS